MTRLVVGCMTGTSIDGLDAALVAIEGAGLSMKASTMRCISRPLGPLAEPLRRLADQVPMAAGDIARLNQAFSRLHAETASELLAGSKADLAAIHGQTVFHAPPVSWQLFNPTSVARALNCPVVCDLRAADLAAGGQGAPITPLADWVLFRAPGESRAVVNLGGFCNFTLLPPTGTQEAAASTLQVSGGDICACNHLLDTVARRVLGVPFDSGGAAALSGAVNDEALDDLLGVLAAQSGSKRSLGTGDESMAWVGRHRTVVSGQDLAATACEAIAQTLASRVQGAGRVLVAGGGVQNGALRAAISSCCSTHVDSTSEHGVAPEYREAVCMAVLGVLSQDRVPITLSAVTGCAAPPVAGVWTNP